MLAPINVIKTILHPKFLIQILLLILNPFNLYYFVILIYR